MNVLSSAARLTHPESMQRRYVLISPCRDEAQYMRRTLDSIASQTVQPTLWVVVDDGSTDQTPEILAAYAERLPYLKVVTRADRGRRAVGPGVIEAFYAGLEVVDLDQFDYLCKLDLDLDLPRRYFEILIQRMEADPRLGTFSGKPWVTLGGRLVPEPAGNEMSVGMTKFFRTSCFRQIGGFVREVMWDGIDCHRARLLGWRAGSSDEDPDLRFAHLRPMGSSQVGIRTGRQRHGFGQWFMGTGPLYILASSVFRMAHPPYFTGGFLIFWGYVKAWREKVPRYGDTRFRRYLQRHQRLMLTRGKRAATALIEQEQGWAFDPRRPFAPMGQVESAEPDSAFAGLPRRQLHRMSLQDIDARRCAEAVATARLEQRGGWIQLIDANAAARYRRDAAFAQLLQAADIRMAPTPDLVDALSGLRLARLWLRHEGCASGLVKPESRQLMLPRWTWEGRNEILETVCRTVREQAAELLFCELDSPQQEWLVNALRHEFPRLWTLAPVRLAGGA